MFFGHELFSRNTSDAKDYALYYKYRAQSMNGMVGYVVLNSTAVSLKCEKKTIFFDFSKSTVLAQNSSGSISANHDMDFDKERIVEANASIRNASNFNVDMKILGFSSGVNLDGFGFLHRYRTPFKPRSFAVICGVVPNRRMQKQRTLEFGKRINGDFLVRFERNQVMTKGSKFPTHTFDFFDGGINITYVKLTIDVSRKLQSRES